MKRLVVVACALTLSSAGSALAAGPSVAVAPTSDVFAAPVSAVLRFTDDGTQAPASHDLYVPGGYGVALSQPFGATIGGIEGRAKASTGTETPLSGAVTAADPASFAQEAQACTPTHPVHDAVWVVGLNTAGSSAQVPMFVDRAPTSTLAAHLRLCLPPLGAPGAELRLARATITLNGVFTNPSVPGDYRWTSVFGYATIGVLATASETLVRLPRRLTVTAKPIRSPAGRSFVRVAGKLAENGHPVAGVRVQILAGARASVFQRLAYATSYVGGTFSVVAPLRQKTFFQARATTGVREGPVAQCRSSELRPDAVCTSLTYAPLSVQSRRIAASPRRVRVPR